MICKNCGNKINGKNAKFCTECGEKLIEDLSNSNDGVGKNDKDNQLNKKAKRNKGCLISVIACFLIIVIIGYFAGSNDSSGNEEYGGEEVYYPGNTVCGDNIEATLLAYYNSGTELICYFNIVNVSGETITFNAGDYFSLNANGIIEQGYSADYDWETISNGAAFSTFVNFYLPNNFSINYDMMYLTMDGQTISFRSDPQYSDLDSFEGTYRTNNGGLYYMILNNGDGTYNVVTVSPNVTPNVSIWNTTLYDDNSFYIGDFWDRTLRWDNESGCIIDDFAGHTYYKQN